LGFENEAQTFIDVSLRFAIESLHLGDESLHLGDESLNLNGESLHLGDESLNLNGESLHLGDESLNLNDEFSRFVIESLNPMSEDLSMRTVKPISRRRPGSLDDEPLVKDGIPAGRLGNRTFPTASMARQAAIAESNRLNQTVYPGHSVARSDAHRPGELPHYHVIDPQGKQISGHFFYGRKPYRVEPGRGGNLQQSIAAATKDINPRLSDWQAERQHLQEKLKSGQANRQEKGRLKWLNYKLRSAIQQQKRRDAQQLGAEIHAARQSKRKAQREQEGEMNPQSQWLFEAPFVSEFTEQINYSNFELMADREASPTTLRSVRFRSNSRLQAAANNRPPMRPGERGLAVQKLQQALIDLGFPMPVSTRRRGTPDGIYGAETTSIVRKFQRQNGLRVDGVVGRNTMSRLDQLFSPSGVGSCDQECERLFQDCRTSRGLNECRRLLRRCQRDCRGVPV
jgi:hypothetical protein